MDPGKCSECDKELVVGEKIRCVYCELSQTAKVNSGTSSADTNCGVCDVFTIRDKESLNCELCKRWYHNNCNDVALDDQYCTLVYEAPKNIKWFCDKCVWETEKWINEFTFDIRTDGKDSVAVGHGKHGQDTVEQEHNIVSPNNKGKRKLTRQKDIPKCTCKKAKIENVIPEARVTKNKSRNTKTRSRKIIKTSLKNIKNNRNDEIDIKELSKSTKDTLSSGQNDNKKELMIKEEIISDQEFQPEEDDTDSEYSGEDKIIHAKKKYLKKKFKYNCDKCPKVFRVEQRFEDHKLWHTGVRSYKCSVCKKGFRNKYLLKNHTMMVHSDEPYMCDICGNGFKNVTLLKDHAKMVHSHENPYICDVCGKGYPSEKQLKQHIANDFHCDKCSRLFQDTQTFEAHTLWHTGDRRPFKCSVCDKGFFDKAQLQNHTVAVHSDEPYICGICGNGFKIATLLKDHTKLVHSQGKPYNCDICGKGYKREDQLKSHIANVFHCDKCSRLFKDLQIFEAHKLWHTGVEKPYKCSDCNKVFRTKKKLKEHTMMHSDEKPYICDICGKGFKREDQLKSHIIRHSKEHIFHCPECDYVCKKKIHLTSHLLSHNGEVLNCSICDFQTNKQHALNSHMRKHSKKNSERKLVICDECGKQFKSMWVLKIHKRTHSSERPYKCEICEKGFKEKRTLSIHMFSHTKAKNVFCPVCEFGFPTKTRLTQHVKTVHSDEKPFECERCGNKYKTKHNLDHHQRGIRGTCHGNNVNNQPKQSGQNPKISSESNSSNVNSSESIPFMQYNNQPGPLLVNSTASDSNSCESAGHMGQYNYHPPPLLVYTGADAVPRAPLYSNSHVTATIHCPPPHISRITGHYMG